MKKFLFLMLALVLVMTTSISTAFADGCECQPTIHCDDGCDVPWSESYPPNQCSSETIVTTTTVTTYTTVETCVDYPCEPQRPALCYDPCERALKNALKDIIRVSDDAKCLIERELMHSDWELVKWCRPKCVKRDKSARVIRYASFRNKTTGETYECFFIVRTSETVCDYVDKGYRNYSGMFVTNFNAPGSKQAAHYEDDWLITEYGGTIGGSVADFVDMLEAGELSDSPKG